MVTRHRAGKHRPAAPAPAAAPGVQTTSQSPRLDPGTGDDSNPVGAGTGLGTPVGYDSDLAGWRSPQFVPGAPMRLPGLVRGPTSPLISGQPSPTTPTPSISSATAVLDPHHYANVVSATLVVSQAAIQAPFLTQPASLRNFLLLRNTHATANIYIDYQTPASVNSPLKIAAGQTFLFDEVVPQNDLYAFADAAAVTLAYGFSNIAGSPPA